MKLLIINNLSSGLQEGGIYDFIRAFSKDNDEITLYSTDGTTDFRTFLRNASSYDAVVVSGGDGSIATASYFLRNTGIPLVPFPAGTANLLCSNLLQPNEPHALAQMVRAGKTLDFDMVEMSIGDKSFGFNLMAGAGYDASIMRDATAAKPVLGQVAYFTAAAANIKPQVSRLRITIDDEVLEREGVGVLLMNHSKIQFDIPLSHNANPRDGLVDVAILKSDNALGLLPALGAAILDRNGEFPSRSSHIEIHSGKSVFLECEPALPVEFDGEPLDCNTPFFARVLPGAARFIVSNEAYEAYFSA